MIGGFLQILIAPWGLSPALPINEGLDGVGLVATPRCDSSGVLVHAPSQVSMRISGTYVSVLPDGQVAQVLWDDGLRTYNYQSGSQAGLCDTVLSANLLTLSDGATVEWDLHDLSEADNDIGHGDGQDNLGLEQCTSRVYALFVKNREDSESTMVVGNATTNEWTAVLDAGSTLTLPADSIFAITSELPTGMLVDGTADCNLMIESSGGDLRYGLNWIGCSV